jgi:hypothetical protein
MEMFSLDYDHIFLYFPCFSLVSMYDFVTNIFDSMWQWSR